MSDEIDPMVSADAQSDGVAAHQDAVAKPVSRRAALKVLGSVPIAGASVPVLTSGVSFSWSLTAPPAAVAA